MRASDFLTELFKPDTAWPLEWEKHGGDYYATAEDNQGRTIDISFVNMGSDQVGDILDIEFSRGGSHSITGKGDAVAVFATVLNAVRTVINKTRPMYIKFLSSEPSRTKLYDALVKRVSGEMGYTRLRRIPAELTDAFVQVGVGELFILKDTSLDEGWKSKVAAAGVGAALALGAGKYVDHKVGEWETAKRTQAAKDAESKLEKPAAPVAKDAESKLEKPAASVAKPKPEKPSDIRRATLEKYAADAGIAGIELAQLMAQAEHESLNFRRTREIGSDRYLQNRYDKRFNRKTAKDLGNTKNGDGVKYCGRGFLQITGRYNYEKAGKYLGLPLLDNPEMAENDLDVAAKVSIWFWFKFVRPKIKDFTDTEGVTRIINPGMHSLDKRIALFAQLSKDMNLKP